MEERLTAVRNAVARVFRQFTVENYLGIIHVKVFDQMDTTAFLTWRRSVYRALPDDLDVGIYRRARE